MIFDYLRTTQALDESIPPGVQLQVLDLFVILFDRIATHPYGVKCNCVKKVYVGDFSDETNIDIILNENKIDLVLHLLSSTVPATSGNAQFDVESNLIPTLKLLSIMDRYDVKDIVYMSFFCLTFYFIFFAYFDTQQIPTNT